MKDAALQQTVTGLLVRWRSGDADALNKLMPLVYDELRKLAKRHMRSEREGHTLQHTALVHEAYLQLVDMDVSWNGRSHFYAIAARAMRRILVDHARARNRDKRGGEVEKVPLEEGMAEGTAVSNQLQVDILDLDRALERLAQFDPRKSDMIELHYFGGLTHQEMAEVTGLSPTSVDRELHLAKAWITRELKSESV